MTHFVNNEDALFVGAPIAETGSKQGISVVYQPIDLWFKAIRLGSIFELNPDDTAIHNVWFYKRSFLAGAVLMHTLAGNPDQVYRPNPTDVFMYLGTYRLVVTEHYSGNTKPVEDEVYGVRMLVGEEEIWQVIWVYPRKVPIHSSQPMWPDIFKPLTTTTKEKE